MGIIDFLLNLAGLLLWVSWRSLSIERLVKAVPASLTGTIKRAGPPRSRRWYFLAGLAALLGLRALLYWQIGPSVGWVPHLGLGAISIFFRSDIFGRMLLYSALGFAVTLLLFYLWLLLISLVNGRAEDRDPVLAIVRLHLGAVARWPWPIRLLLPLVAVAAAWLALYPLLVRLELIRQAGTTTQRLEQAVLIGLGAYLTWKYLIGALLILCLLGTYVYLGSSPFWAFVLMTGSNLVLPLRWMPLRVGKVDMAPVVALSLVFLAAELAERGLTALYGRLPL
jgi:hypothetical protein